MSILRDASLAPSGEDKINWVRGYMPLLNEIGARFEREKPLKGLKVSVSVHLEAKTAYLAQVLARGGAEVATTGSNPLSTQDDIAAALAKSGVAVYAYHASTADEYTEHLRHTLAFGPDVIVDDGGDFVHLLHGEMKNEAKNVRGGCEETTTGVHRLYAREREGQLLFPMFAVNDADCKHLFDNRYGTGQSVWDGIMRTTNLIVAGKYVVVAGYGWCGRGVAERARGLGAKVIVTEVNPVKAIEAVMDGFEVMTMDEAAGLGDIFVTVTGCRDVIIEKHFNMMKDGAILSNAGHFDVEVDVAGLGKIATEVKQLKKNITGYTLKNGKTLCLLAEGRLVNLAAGDGHPAEIMDMSFALQALCVEYLAKGVELKPAVYKVPDEIDKVVAAMKLKALNCAIDSLTAEQERYLAGWEA